MKKMKSPAVFVFVFVSLFFVSCKKELIRGKGDIVTQERAVSGFTRVKITGSTDVEIVPGTSYRVIVSDYENLVNEVETSISGNELRVGYSRNVWVTRGNSKVTITMPTLNGVAVDGSGNFNISGPYTGIAYFSADISGSGNINMYNFPAEEANVHISGSGDVRGFGLTCNKAKVQVNGSGKTEITVNTLLDVRINGSGDVYYKGNASVNASINGSGKVLKR
jgi:Putative auto-transporter adhesin, head GIN domain